MMSGARNAGISYRLRLLEPPFHTSRRLGRWPLSMNTWDVTIGTGVATDSMMLDRSSIDGAAVLLCRSVDQRQTNFCEQLPEGRIAAKADETLVIEKIQHDLVMRLDTNSQVPDRFALVAESSLGLRHIIRRQLPLFIHLFLFRKLCCEQAVLATLCKAIRRRLSHR